MIYAGDAMYVPDPDRIDISPEHKQRIAALAFIFRFSTLALSLMDEAKLTSASDITRREDAPRHLHDRPAERNLRRAPDQHRAHGARMTGAKSVSCRFLNALLSTRAAACGSCRRVPVARPGQGRAPDRGASFSTARGVALRLPQWPNPTMKLSSTKCNCRQSNGQKTLSSASTKRPGASESGVVDHWREGCIFPAEMAFFLGQCAHNDVEAIVESGRQDGSPLHSRGLGTGDGRPRRLN